jgi:hypothetical protein
MHALTRISKLTEEMAQAAAEADWDRVQLHDAERYELLAALPASCFESGDPAVQIVLEQALMMTNAVLDLARHAQHEQAGSLRGLHRAQRGTRAYLRAEG